MKVICRTSWLQDEMIMIAGSQSDELRSGAPKSVATKSVA